MHAAGSQGGNGSRNGDKKRPAGKPEVSDTSKAKRKLFQRDDEEDREFWQAEEAKNLEHVEEMTKKYNFSFLRDEPLPQGRFAWKKDTSPDELYNSGDPAASTSVSEPTAAVTACPGKDDTTGDTHGPCEKNSAELEQEKDASETTEETKVSEHLSVETDDKTSQGT